MTTDLSRVRDAYTRLAEQPVRPGLLSVADTEVIVAAGTVVLAIDQSGRRCLLIPSERSPRPDRSSRGVSLGVAEYVQPGLEEARYLALRCEMREFSDLFASIATEVLLAIEGDPDNPEKACYAVLERYRELFGPPGRELLGPRALAALFGELVALERVVAAGGHVGQWRGPERHRHDVIGPRAALEVKTTLSAEHRRIVVHGARQLEPPPDRRLFLHLVRVEPAIGGQSVQDIVDRIIDQGGEAAELRRLLEGVGYRSVDVDRYAATQFSILESQTYEVADDFPRLMPETIERLPSGISELRYTLDLTVSGLEPLADGLASIVAEVADS